MPTTMQTVTTTTDYHVLATDWLSFTDQPGFVLQQFGDPAPHLQISGEVDVALTGVGSAVGVAVNNTYNSGPTVTLDAGAILKVTNAVSGGQAVGYSGGGVPQAPPVLTNAGTITVSGDAGASGAGTGVNMGKVTNSGQITATSAHSDATGVSMVGGWETLLNSGSITATGHGQVVGVNMGRFMAQVFNNTGTIVAHDDNTATTSIGVLWGGAFDQGASFVNDGRIEGDEALRVDYLSYGSAADNLFTNHGQLVGAVYFSGTVTLVNTGVITGPINFISPGSIYDGRLGTALGAITGHDQPAGVTFLGGAGAETMTSGMGADSISGGGGNDLIDGGDGRNTLFGGDGDDTIAGAGDAFDQVNGNKGDDIITGKSRVGDWLLGGHGNDSIDAHASTGANIINGNIGADTLVGGSGADTLRGGQGDDVIHAGSGAAWISGDLGNNAIYGGQGANTFHASTGHDSVTGWHSGDQVQLDPGVTYTVTQASADVHVTFSNGGEMDLLGVQQSSLQPGWIVSS